MFIQVIEGKTSNPEAVHQRLDVWERDLKPGATGYLGSTGGCTSGGDCILIARFEDLDAARQNSQRPEQDAWWQQTMKLFDGPVTFHDTSDVDVMSHGDMDGAGFVQVMEGHVDDRDRAGELNREADPVLATERPDLIGMMVAYYGDGDYTEAAYFTSETEAREGERRDMPPQLSERFQDFQQLWHVDRYLDINDPWLVHS